MKQQLKYVPDNNQQQQSQCCMPFFKKTEKVIFNSRRSYKSPTSRGISLMSSRNVKKDNLSLNKVNNFDKTKQISVVKQSTLMKSTVILRNPKILFSYKNPSEDQSQFENPFLLTVKKDSQMDKNQFSTRKNSIINSTATIRLGSTIKTIPDQQSIQYLKNTNQNLFQRFTPQNTNRISSINMEDIREVLSEIDNSQSSINPNQPEFSEIASNDSTLMNRIKNHNIFKDKPNYPTY